MNELALFAGAGGGLLASKWLLGWRTVCYVENAEYPGKVIQARIKDGMLDDAPIWDDARTFDGRPWRGCVDIVTGGFPCQPFSLAGKQQADEDDRNLWPDTIRIIREVQPIFCLLENVSGLLAGSHGYFGAILGDLAESGYDARWRVLSAAEVGAPHRRDRVWIMAHTQSKRETTTQQSRQLCGIELCCEDVAHAKSDIRNTPWNEKLNTPHGASAASIDAERRKCEPWAVEPDVGRVADGVAARVDRLKALGNGQVSAVVARVWGLLVEDARDGESSL